MATKVQISFHLVSGFTHTIVIDATGDLDETTLEQMCDALRTAKNLQFVDSAAKCAIAFPRMENVMMIEVRPFGMAA